MAEEKKPFVETMAWKRFIGKLYGLGAAVVIVGALFKIQHYPGASVMLMVGLLTEAVIFVFSAFEPVHPEIDWTRVYPELKSDRDANPVYEVENAESWEGRIGGSGVGGGKKVALAATPDGSALQKFDEMLEKAGGNNFFEKLGNNFANFNEKVKDMANVADAAAASKGFTDNLQAASSAVSSIQSSADTLNDSLASVGNAFSKVGDIDFSAISSGNQEYNKNISALNKNLGAINQIFEIQMQEVDFDSMISELKGSVQYAQQYSKEVSKLSKNLSALNNVYGNMLTALNVKVD